MHIPTLTTPRLFLRPWQAADAQGLYNILQQEGILDYFPNRTPPSLERVERYIAHHLSHWQEYGYGHWALAARPELQVIGWSGLELLPETGETEVAYLLSKHFWGRGLGTEAAQAALSYGLETVALSCIIGLVHPDNIASRRVLQKIGLSFSNQANYFGMSLQRYVTVRKDNHP
jgi:ribosomal-protein-alanine N-acetyltransferase